MAQTDSSQSGPETTNPHDAQVPTLGPKLLRIREYRAVMSNYAQLGSHRQTVNTVFVSLNAIFLTALGFLLSRSHFNSWWLIVGLTSIAIAIMPINLTWFSILRRYQFMSDVHFNYLRELEVESQRSGRGDDYQAQIGVLSQMLSKARTKEFGTTQLERRLAAYFLILYPLIALGAAILTSLIGIFHILPAVPMP